MTDVVVSAEWRLSELGSEDGPALEALIVACADYYETAHGHPPFPAEAQSIYMALPDGARPESKLVLGVFRASDRELAGVTDVIRDYPDVGSWTLGLLMLTPGERGKGVGTQTYEAFERLARASGAREMILNTRDVMDGAHAFWMRRGFRDDTEPGRTDGFIRMRRRLC